MNRKPSLPAPSGRMTLSSEKPTVPSYSDVRESERHKLLDYYAANYCRTFGMMFDGTVPMSHIPRRR